MPGVPRIISADEHRAASSVGSYEMDRLMERDQKRPKSVKS